MSKKIKYWEPSKEPYFTYATNKPDGRPKTVKRNEINIKVDNQQCQSFKRIQ